MFKKVFDSSYVGFLKDGAQWLVDNTDIKLVGKPLSNLECESEPVVSFFADNSMFLHDFQSNYQHLYTIY